MMETTKGIFHWLANLFLKNQYSKFGSILNSSKAWAKVPALYFPFNLFFKAISRKKSLIEESLRTLISIRVSQLNNCPFCIDMNKYLYLKANSKEKIKNLLLYRTSPIFSEKEKVALEYAEMVTLNKVDDDLRDKLQKHFTDEAIVELTAIAAFQNMSAKFNSALKVESNNLCERESN